MSTVDVATDERTQAISSLRRKRGFRAQVASFVLLNAFLWGLWFVTGGAADQGYWPAWVTFGLSIGLAVSAWHTYGERPISQSDVDAEMQRMRRS